MAYFGLDDSICAADFAVYLMSLKGYDKAKPKEKIDILKPLKEKKLWSSRFGQLEMDNAVKAYLIDETIGLKPSEQGVAGLKIIAKLTQEKVLSWSSFLSNLEKQYLAMYTTKNPEYLKASPMERVKLLKKLNDDKLITSFCLSDTEEPIVAKELLKDKKFMKASNDEKYDMVEKMYRDKIIHSFASSDIRRLLGVKNKKKK